VTERLRARDSIHLELAGGLEAPHRPFGQRAVPAVDRPRREAGVGQVTLECPDRTESAGHIPVAGTEDQLGRSQSCPGHWTIDPVDDQAVRGLEATDGLLGQRAVASVDRPGRIAQVGDATL
jgi:hypothetical protein